MSIKSTQGKLVLSEEVLSAADYRYHTRRIYAHECPYCTCKKVVSIMGENWKDPLNIRCFYCGCVYEVTHA